jgi:hypothetical protein
VPAAPVLPKVFAGIIDQLAERPGQHGRHTHEIGQTAQAGAITNKNFASMG